MKKISKYNFIIIFIIILIGSISIVRVAIAACATTTTTTKPSSSTTTTTVSGPVTKYKCTVVNNLNQCIVDSNGIYTSKSSCELACPDYFSCSKSPLGCYPSSSGYIWKDACENNCYYGFNCYPGYVCSYGFLGNYTSLGSCELCCKNPDPCNTYYSCNPDPNNPRCVVDSGGSYASWSYCADNCGSNGGNPPPTSPPPTSPPPTIPETEPCIISYLRLPSKAWVNYSITGTWLASDWCNDCDINCSPYPACVWQEEGIGTGPDENSFILEQAGTYYYTLICHGDDDEDSISDSIKVDAFNIPWWQEIIPVLPSFLRGIWK